MKGDLTISRTSNGLIHIQVRDDASRLVFADISIRPEDFGNCITGMSHVAMKFSVSGLQNVGKVKDVMTIEFPLPEHNYDNRTTVAIKAADRYVKSNLSSDWASNNCFNSRNSFYQMEDGTQMARTTAVRYV